MLPASKLRWVAWAMLVKNEIDVIEIKVTNKIF
jgi:hypothetical protein